MNLICPICKNKLLKLYNYLYCSESKPYFHNYKLYLDANTPIFAESLFIDFGTSETETNHYVVMHFLDREFKYPKTHLFMNNSPTIELDYYYIDLNADTIIDDFKKIYMLI